MDLFKAKKICQRLIILFAIEAAQKDGDRRSPKPVYRCHRSFGGRGNAVIYKQQSIPGAQHFLAVRQAHKKNQKKYDTFMETKKLALQLKIPILNTNRFLAMTGYTPETKVE